MVNAGVDAVIIDTAHGHTKGVVTVLAIGLIGMLSFTAASAQSLDDLMEKAVAENLELKVLEQEYLAALEKAPQVSQLPDPELGLGAFPLPVETRLGAQTARLSATQMFPWFGTLAAKGEMATLMAEAKYQVFLNARNELYYKVKAAWYPLYEVNRTLLLQEENRDILYNHSKLVLII